MCKYLYGFLQQSSYKKYVRFLIIILTIFLITEFSRYPKASTIKYPIYQQTPVLRSDNLEMGKQLNQHIEAHKSHFYKVDLVEGQYIKVLIEQKGADLEVKLLEADDKLVVMTDNPFGQQGTEVLEAIINVSGSYKIELINHSPKEGNYTIELKELRMASSKDKVLVTERFLAEEISAFGRDLYQNQKNKNDILKALAAFEKALPHSQASENKAIEADILNEIGRMYYLLEKNQEAVSYYNKVLAIAPTISDPIGKGAIEAGSYNNLGQIAYYQPNYQEAFDNYKKAYDISTKLNLEDQIARSINNLANLYMFFSDLDQAIRLYKEALIIHQQTGDLNSQAVVLNNLGSAHSYLNKMPEAENLFKQVIALNNKDISIKNSALRNLGVLYAKQGKIEQTLENFQKALEGFQKLEIKSEEGYTLMLLGEIYYKNSATHKDNLKALDCLNKALPLLRSDNRNLPLANNLRLLAEVQFEMGDVREAQKNIEQAISLITFTRKNILNLEFRQSYAEIVQNSYDLYISLLMKQHFENPSAGYDVKAFQVSEQARARNLLELLAQSHIDIKYGVSKELVDKEQNLIRKLEEQEFSLIKLANNKLEDSEEAKTVKKEQQKTLRELREVLVEIKQQNPSFIALPEAEPLGLEAIQKQILDPESLILEYFLGDTKSYLWVISQTKIVSYVLPGRKEINNLAQEVYQLLSTKGKLKTSENLVKTAQRFSLKQLKDDDRVYWQKAKELSQVLLPEPEQFKQKRLIIVPDESLHYIPFGALPLNSIAKTNSKKNNQLVPLLQTNEIVNLPSVSIVAFLKENPRQQISDKKILVIADPVFSLDDPRFNIESVKKLPNPKNEEISSVVREQNFARLTASLKEANSITNMLDETRFKKFLGFEANKANFLAENLISFRFIHFATHGQINDQNPELSRIVFSLLDEKGELQNAFLSLYEIYNLRLQADLVVLSTCQSALGKELKAEGIVGLTQGFMTAGASRVISSLWNVNDNATAKLMENFYKKVLKENKTPSQALRLAQIELSKDERFKSPYLWAPFVLQGKWN